MDSEARQRASSLEEEAVQLRNQVDELRDHRDRAEELQGVVSRLEDQQQQVGCGSCMDW